MAKMDQFFAEMGGLIGKTIRKPKRIYFDVDKNNLTQVVEYLFNRMHCRLSTATATETYHNLEVLYHFSHDASGDYYCPRVLITDKQKPAIPSITPIVRGAEWIEREMFDFWGIEFIGHPNLIRLLARDHPQGLDKPLRFRRDK
ncbi:MAG TPA: NADH-quinone oxidoreductase subunit C [bacterium]|nr:NADH-quinone oxidoreductase subunit C [bacterium]HPG47278.1 NADH-quinone oxidoreductase subunit C [bacterium]HPM99516.1 NADH-quinone oxidoreductase subunit C [bacterium]